MKQHALMSYEHISFDLHTADNYLTTIIFKNKQLLFYLIYDLLLWLETDIRMPSMHPGKWAEKFSQRLVNHTCLCNLNLRNFIKTFFSSCQGSFSINWLYVLWMINQQTFWFPFVSFFQQLSNKHHCSQGQQQSSSQNRKKNYQHSWVAFFGALRGIT